MLSLLSVAAFAQSGSITGKIVDEFGEPVSGASIVASNARGQAFAVGQEFKATSASTGKYTIDRLPPGAYEITVAAATLTTFVKKGFAVAGTAHLDVTLADGDGLGTLGDGDRFSEAFFASQKAPPPPSGPTPLQPDGNPDLSGFWQSSFSQSFEGPPEPTEPLPWAEAIRRERQASNLRDDPYGRCLPRGIMSWAGQGKFVHTASMLVLLSTGEPSRQIFLDGRGHPQNVNPTWQGHSVGHWEGDTLVVDTVGFNGLIWYNSGLPATEMLHVVERYHRIDLGHLETEITVEDSAVLRRPWTIKRTSILRPDDDIREFVCTENNRDIEHMVGK